MKERGYTMINCFGAFVDCDIVSNTALAFRHTFITNGKVQSVDITLCDVPENLVQKAKKRIELSNYKIDSILYGQIYENIYIK